MTEADGKRPLSFIEDEQIEFKPSTELIPDEYERKNNENFLVELICRQTDEDADDLGKHLTSLGFPVHKTFIDRILNIMDENWIKDFVAGVNNLSNENNYDGLLIIFAKVSFRSDMLKAIWGSFTSKECPALKNKPKIFIFQIFKRGPSSDTGALSQVDLTKAYDTPSEADILLVFDKITAESSSDFLENFHQHIKDYAQQEDIINLISLCIGSESRPLVISTMTRKFFFTLQRYRGHHHNISEYHTEIKENLEKIIKFVKNTPDHKLKEKGFVNTVMRTLSFKKKHVKQSETRENIKLRGSDTVHKLNDVKEEKHVSDAPEQSEVRGENAAGTSIKKGKPKPLKPPEEIAAVPPSKSPTRKTSIPQPITPTRRTSKPRLPSGTFSSKEDLTPKKKPWK